MAVDEKNDFQIGVQVILLRSNEILLGRRAGIFGHGTWGLPGGRLRQGETLLEAAARELEEEVGVIAENLRIVAIADATMENNFQLQIGVEVAEWKGSPSIKEPDKCDQLEFFPLSAIPTELFVASSPIIKRYGESKLYVAFASHE